MIETPEQRAKRMKSEEKVRADRAAHHSEVIARQNAELGRQPKRREIWRPLGYGSWAKYGAAEFGKGKSRMYQLVDFAETKELLSESTIVESPLKESQTRPMNDLSPKQKKKAWKRAVTIANGQPNAAQVRQAVAEIKPEPEPMEPTPATIPAEVTESEAIEQAKEIPPSIWERKCPHCGGAI